MVKSWFGWIGENFKGSIAAHSALANYWRTLKGLYVLQNRKDIEESMWQDCLNYMKVVSWQTGLRRCMLHKPIEASTNLLEFLITHLVHCDSVYADERQ